MDEVHPRNWSKLRTCLTGRKIGLPYWGLNLLEPRLVKPLTTVIIPLDDRVGSRSLAHAVEIPVGTSCGHFAILSDMTWTSLLSARLRLAATSPPWRAATPQSW